MKKSSIFLLLSTIFAGGTLFAAFSACSCASIDETQHKDVMCTQDAKQCADGTWVGRSGPNCEFKCLGAEASQ